MACSLPTGGIVHFRNNLKLVHSVIQVTRYRALSFAYFRYSSQIGAIAEARRTNCILSSVSRYINGDGERQWYSNFDDYPSRRKRAPLLSHRRVRPMSLSRLFSSPCFVLNSEVESKLDFEDRSMIDFLVRYRDSNGDCHIPTGNTKNAREERQNLGVPTEVADWVVKQRKNYRLRKKKKVKMTDSMSTKFTMLESIGFMWSCREAKWQRFFNKLEQSYQSQGEGNLIRIKEKDDPHLHAWIEQQRKAYRKGTMPIERENLLRDIDFVFDPNDAQWWENYRKLRTFYNEHGDTMVPLLDDDENPNYLGQWVARQRRLYQSDSLREDRIVALNGICFSWDPEAESWERHYKQLCDFHRIHKHTRVPKSMGSLWNWVDRQRRSYRKRLRLGNASKIGYTDETDKSRGALITKENVEKLSTIGFEWEDTPPKGDAENRMRRLMNVTFELSLHDENWANHFEKLCAFYEKFNHFSIPTSSGEYKELNTWVRHTRYLYNSNKLPKNRIELLDSIGFAWTAEDAKWDRLCEEFLSFHKENGHGDVPTKNTELYRWTKQQKENHKSFDEYELGGSKAKTERKRRLHSLQAIFV